MPSFRHQSMDRGGALATGTIAAPDRASAMRLLQGQGLLPMQLDMAEAEAPAKAAKALAGGLAAFRNDITATRKLREAAAAIGVPGTASAR